MCRLACRIITARSQAAMGGMALTFMRLVVHPFLWGILLMTFRFFIRNCGAFRLPGVLLPALHCRHCAL
jgi:hypothetical protein